MIEYDVTVAVKVRVQKDSGEEAEKFTEQRIYDDLKICFDDCDDIQLLPSIQKNPHGLTETHLFCFHMIDSQRGKYDMRDAIKIWKEYGMETVPIVNENYILPDDFEAFKDSATGFYDASVCEGKTQQAREGYVYYKTTDPAFSFKNVSREYLLAHNG